MKNGKFFCKHNWILCKIIRQYYNFNGIYVEICKVRCAKCGKKKNKKYIYK